MNNNDYNIKTIAGLAKGKDVMAAIESLDDKYKTEAKKAYRTGGIILLITFLINAGINVFNLFAKASKKYVDNRILEYDLGGVVVGKYYTLPQLRLLGKLEEYTAAEKEYVSAKKDEDAAKKAYDEAEETEKESKKKAYDDAVKTTAEKKTEMDKIRMNPNYKEDKNKKEKKEKKNK